MNICAFLFTAKFNAAPDLAQRATDLCGYWAYWFSHCPEATSPQAWAALQTYTSGVTFQSYCLGFYLIFSYLEIKLCLLMRQKQSSVTIMVLSPAVP